MSTQTVNQHFNNENMITKPNAGRAVHLVQAIAAAVLFTLTTMAHAQESQANPNGDAGALKEMVETGGGYSPHSGNASRSVTDLEVRGAVGQYGLDFTRTWNSTKGGWTHSWDWGTDWVKETLEDSSSGSIKISYKTTIIVNCPDGSTRTFWSIRTAGSPDNWDTGGNGERISNDFWGPKYVTSWQNDPASEDRLRDMDPYGLEFWLYRADGGSVRFQRPSLDTDFRATEVFDRYGLKTVLIYDGDGRLTTVRGEDGRELRLIWDFIASPNPYQAPVPVLQRVETGSGAGLQTVRYDYAWDPISGSDVRVLVLAWAHYMDNISAEYHYLNGYLIRADDPQYAGAMRTIRYAYGSKFDKTPVFGYSGTTRDFFIPADTDGLPIAEEQSGTEDIAPGAPVPVSSLTIYPNGPDAGKRLETKGSGGRRMFYFGHSGGTEPGSFYTDGSNGTGYWTPPEAAPYLNDYRNRSFQLGKLTDFAANPEASDTPFEFQRYFANHPRRLFDGEGTFTEVISDTAGGGRVMKIRFAGAGEGERTFEWITPSAGTSPTDTTRIRNPYHHWLFAETVQRDAQTTFTTTYVRDDRRRVFQTLHPDGSYEEFHYNLFNQVTDHRLPSGSWKHYRYDGRGLLEREWNDHDGEGAQKTYTHDAFGRVETMTDARARAHGRPFSVKLTYNARHQVLTEEYPARDGGSNPWKKYRYDKYGNCTHIWSEVAPNKDDEAHATRYDYDEYRRCIRMVEPLHARNWNNSGHVADRTWNWYYDRYDHLLNQYYHASSHTSKQWRVQVEPPFNAAGDRRLSARKYDYNDRIIEENTGLIEKADGTWHGTEATSTQNYDYDKNGNKRWFRDAMGRETTYTYDKRDRLKTTTEPLGRVTENWYDYLGNKTMIRLPDERTQEWQNYDAFGQARRFIDERANPIDFVYERGPMKLLLSVTTYRTRYDGNTEPQPTSFYTDGMGRPWRTNYPDGTYEETLYRDGQVHTWESRGHAVKTMQYDARGREAHHSWSDGTPEVWRQWDDAHRLRSIENKFSRIEYDYDAAGQVLNERNIVAGSGGITRTYYDRYPNGQVAHYVHPNGWWSRRDYNARHQLKTVGWDDGWNWVHKLVDYTYLRDGQVWYQYYGNGAQTGFGHDARGKINVAHTHRQQPQYENYSFREYRRDDRRDRITSWRKRAEPSVTGRENGRGDIYQYDAEGQLTRAFYEAVHEQDFHADDNFVGWNGSTEQYYDQLGNRRGWNWQQSRGGTDYYRANNGLNQYGSWSGGGMNYNANGDLTGEGFFSASYNALNQPISIQTAGMSAPMWFGYDPLGRPVKRWVGGSGHEATNPATYLYYDGWSLVQEGPNAASATRIYFHGNRIDETIASYEYPSATGGDLWNHYHYDARTHVSFLTDWWGNLVEQYDYHAFGNVYTMDGQGNYVGMFESPRGNRFFFTGREWLSDVKLYDFRKRLYHPEMGRFLQPDPTGFKSGDYNLYRYCHNDPVNRIDPEGEAWALLPLLGKILADEAIDKGLDKARDHVPEEHRKTFDKSREIYDLFPKPSKIVKNPGAALSSYKAALKKVHEAIGRLPKGKPGKFGSPQAGDSKKGYRLDPAHPDAPPGSPEQHPHINYWDYTAGKRGKGGIKGAVPITDETD